MKTYNAKRVTGKMTITDKRWDMADVASLDYVWENSFPSPFKTEARAVYSEEGVTVLLTTDEWPLRITHYEDYSDYVCEDSCLEFFFIPSNRDGRFINLEVNPVGIAHFRIGPNRYEREPLSFDGSGIRIETMITPHKGWRALISVPFEYLKGVCGEVDKSWRVNFFKCGDLTETVHYCTWSPVLTEEPDYHTPEYFGVMNFTDGEIM